MVFEIWKASELAHTSGDRRYQCQIVCMCSNSLSSAPSPRGRHQGEWQIIGTIPCSQLWQISGIMAKIRTEIKMIKHHCASNGFYMQLEIISVINRY